MYGVFPVVNPLYGFSEGRVAVFYGCNELQRVFGILVGDGKLQSVVAVQVIVSPEGDTAPAEIQRDNVNGVALDDDSAYLVKF